MGSPINSVPAKDLSAINFLGSTPRSWESKIEIEKKSGKSGISDEDTFSTGFYRNSGECVQTLGQVLGVSTSTTVEMEGIFGSLPVG